jgi:hypothetical protein
MFIKESETEIGGQGPVRAVELLKKKYVYSMFVFCVGRGLAMS